MKDGQRGLRGGDWQTSLHTVLLLQQIGVIPDDLGVHVPVGVFHQPHCAGPKHQEEHEGLEACRILGILFVFARPLDGDLDAIASGECVGH